RARDEKRALPVRLDQYLAIQPRIDVQAFRGVTQVGGIVPHRLRIYERDHAGRPARRAETAAEGRRSEHDRTERESQQPAIPIALHHDRPPAPAIADCRLRIVERSWGKLQIRNPHSKISVPLSLRASVPRPAPPQDHAAKTSAAANSTKMEK